MAISLDRSLIGDAHHARKINLISGRSSDFEGLVIRVPECKRDQLTRRYTRVQSEAKEARSIRFTLASCEFAGSRNLRASDGRLFSWIGVLSEDCTYQRFSLNRDV